MRAKIMLLHFAPPLLLLLLQLVDVRSADPIDSPKGMGSRSMVHRANDFRLADEKLKSNSVVRIKRSDEDSWMRSQMNSRDDFVKMHAFVVKDEDIPDECDTPADKVTKRRYFMCSGVILDEKHVLTSATCVNQAHIHEYHIEADLAVLIGALDENSYAIRISHYEIHPRYVPDPNSDQHATNNIALLRLACSIPRKYVVVPRLPFKRFEDVAHLCCPDRCRMTTVIESSENQHFLRLMKLRHLPSPMHVDTRNSSVGPKKRNAVNSNLPPDDKSEGDDANKELILRILRSRSVRQLINDDAKTTKLSSFSRSSEDIVASKNVSIRENRKKSVNHFEDDDGAIDWENVKMEIYGARVSEKNQKLLSNFIQNSMSDIMTKLLEVVTHHIADMNNVFGYFQSVLQEEILWGDDPDQKISDLVGRSLLKFALEEMSMIPDLSEISCKQDCSKCINQDDYNGRNHLGNKNSESTYHNDGVTKDYGSPGDNKGQIEMTVNKIGQESERLVDKDGNVIVYDNIHCPPLGSPVVVNKTLVGLIAYTCDDAQNWVEWKYVNIVQNIRWIRQELSRNPTQILQDSDTPHLNNN